MAREKEPNQRLLVKVIGTRAPPDQVQSSIRPALELLPGGSRAPSFTELDMAFVLEWTAATSAVELRNLACGCGGETALSP